METLASSDPFTHIFVRSTYAYVNGPFVHFPCVNPSRSLVICCASPVHFAKATFETKVIIARWKKSVIYRSECFPSLWKPKALQASSCASFVCETKKMLLLFFFSVNLGFCRAAFLDVVKYRVILMLLKNTQIDQKCFCRKNWFPRKHGWREIWPHFKLCQQ